MRVNHEKEIAEHKAEVDVLNGIIERQRLAGYKMAKRIAELEGALKKCYMIISEYEMFRTNPDCKQAYYAIEQVLPTETAKDKD